jgi:hypothetical protein
VIRNHAQHVCLQGRHRLNGSCGALLQKLQISPAYLRNDNNEYLHYTDDWYILDSQPDKYVVIYYRGNNDAWKGYGGATIYTRCETGPQIQDRSAGGIVACMPCH